MNKFRTQSLFLEYVVSKRARPDRYFPIWTLRNEDLKIKNPANWYYSAYEDHIYPSLKKLYIAFADPTEYAFAMEYFGSWEHWKVLQECTWFKPILKEWRKDLEIKLRAEAIATVRDAAKHGDVQAAKWLHGISTASEKKGRGRPSKEELEGELKRQVSEDKEMLDDLARIHPTPLQ